MNINTAILNAAMKAYLQTFTSNKNLKAYLHDNGLLDLEKQIESELQSVIRTADDHLFNYPGGVPCDPPFRKNYTQLLLKAHPWTDDLSLARIMQYSEWICWHDGLNAQKT